MILPQPGANDSSTSAGSYSRPWSGRYGIEGLWRFLLSPARSAHGSYPGILVGASEPCDPLRNLGHPQGGPDPVLRDLICYRSYCDSVHANTPVNGFGGG